MKDPPVDRGQLKHADFLGIPAFLGMALFSMEGIGLVFPLRSSIKNTAQFKSVFNGVLALVLVICLMFGVMSYTAFGVETPEIIFLAFGPKYEILFFLEVLYATVSFYCHLRLSNSLGNLL